MVLIVCEDGNGITEIVAVCIVAEENENVMRSFFQNFKMHHSDIAHRISSFMGDKDQTIRKVIKDLFEVPMYICTFHAQQAFRNAVVKMKLEAAVRDECLELFRLLVYSKCKETYDFLLVKFQSVAPAPVIEYFAKNWESCKAEWVYYLVCEENFNNGTNNRLESLNGNVKRYIGKMKSFVEFLQGFFVYLRLSHKERNQVAANACIQIRRLTLYNGLIEYKKYLTPYAYNYIANEYGLKTHVKKQNLC